MATATFTKLDSYTVSSATPTITFSNIPQTYTDLVIKMSVRSEYGATVSNISLLINGFNFSSALFRNQYFSGNGATVTANQPLYTGGDANFIGFQPGSTATANAFANSELYFANYTSNTYVKNCLVETSMENVNATAYTTCHTINFDSTSPITSISIKDAVTNHAVGSTFTLYGVFNQDVSSSSSAPTIGTATAGSQAASITFTGVSGAASYTMTSSPGSITGTGSSSPVVVSGLTSGTAYTFTAKANNPFGSSGSSAASNSATPVTATAYFAFSSDYGVFYSYDMALDVTTITNLSLTNENGGVASNSGVSGYKYGTTTDPKTACQKFSYSTLAVSNLSNALPQARMYATGGSNSGTAAYITGGATSSFVVRYKTTVKSPFSTDTFSTLGTSFTQMGNANAYASNNHTAGYTFGGESDTSPYLLTDINKINYSNDAISSNIASMSVAGRSNAAFSNDGTAAYFGNGTGATNAINKLTYSSETRSILSATLTTSALAIMPVAYRFQTAGFYIGGYNPVSGLGVTERQKLLFSNETMSNMSPALATAASSFNQGELSNNGVI